MKNNEKPPKEVSEEIKKACELILKSDKGSLVVEYFDRKIVVSGVYLGRSVSIVISIQIPPILVFIESKVKINLNCDFYVDKAKAFGNDDLITPITIKVFLEAVQRRIKDENYAAQEAYSFLMYGEP